MMELPPRARLEQYLLRARQLAQEGVPVPHKQVSRAVDAALLSGRRVEAVNAIVAAEQVLDAILLAWEPIRELFAREDRLRDVALGLGLEPVETHPGQPDPRELLRAGPLSGSLLRRVQAEASAGVRVLSKQILSYGVSESRKLGLRIRAAGQRGEDVSETTEEFRQLVRTIGARAAVDVGVRLAELRRAAARIPSAPAFPVPMTDEEQETLTEARQFARRIHRIKRTALDAQSAARMMSHVRAALSEDRRFGTPQEEVEELWGEVARLTSERVAAGGPLGLPPTPHGTVPSSGSPADGAGGPLAGASGGASADGEGRGDNA